MPHQLMESMLASVKQFVHNADQSDDLTMLAVRYRQPEEQELLHETITLQNDVKQVTELNNFVKSVGDRLNLEPSLVSQLMLAVEEAVVNVMNYAYPIGTQGDVMVTAAATAQSVKFIIADEGKAFDPTQGGNADTTLSAEERPIGGLGILLVRQLMDTINYERIDGKNVLTINKNYNKNINNETK
jgi:sigma-B regulation protein RsbU (phosphoserine phosphatase)